MLNGETIEVRQYIYNNDDSVKEITEIMEICRSRNPKILTQWTQQDYYNYMENAALYKNGVLPLPQQNLERLTRRMGVVPSQYEENPPSSIQSQVPFGYQIPYANTERGVQLEYWKRKRACGKSFIIPPAIIIALFLIMFVGADKDELEISFIVIIS